ncbi:MAG TPA: hypothetical protein VFM58_24895 [Solirubrobacteraceae bacterium]|nr:hypothetical protein [Solirubrobacteraceae bacterium]
MRIAATIAASLAALLSLGLLAAGGVLLWGESKKDEQGYLTTRTERFSTGSYALVTGNLDLDLDGLDEVLDDDTYGKIRLEVDSGTPVFVGIARTADVTRYVGASAHALVTDVSYPDFDADYDERPGTARPAAPAAQDIWAASAHGPGRQTLTWDVEDGDWSIVVMNADASRGVDARISAGAEAPLMAPLGWGMAIAGLLMLAFAAGATVVAVRVPRRRAVAA